MTRCRETAGILFSRRCDRPAIGECTRCKKPICDHHGRRYWQSVACVACLRTLIKQQPQERQSQAHLRDDPYFYWYYVDDGWDSEPYDGDDFALFQDAGPDFGSDVQDGWQGT
ncbi:MAG: hypothetical protein R3B72_26405 [Polyangiaceae bacterium]